MNEVTALAQQLIQIPSITPKDMGCQELLISRLKKLGFTITKLPFAQTDNFWAQLGNTEPLFVFAGHTDVVPTGDKTAWHYPPFEGIVDDNYIHGRGAADMKGSLAAMIIAVENFLARAPLYSGSVGFLITSAEEGPSHDGTPIVLDYLQQKNITMDYCIVGEPTSNNALGDTIKNGRRGSLTGELTFIGKQGHIAYPHLAENPIHQAMNTLSELINIVWCEGNQDFDASCFQISNINAGTGAGNVIPGTLEVLFNIRYSPEITAETIQSIVHQQLDKAGLDYKLDWTHFGKPYHTLDKSFLNICQSATQEIMGDSAKLSTSGGTSDARYIAAVCPKIIELGPINATIHQINECVAIKDLVNLSDIYLKILQKCLTS